MRTPRYLDVDLLTQMADYYGVPVPRDAQVTRKVVDTTDRGLGFDKVAKGHRDWTATEEVTETYQSELRPVKLFNDIVDSLTVSDTVCDLTSEPNVQIIHRHPVLAEGEVELAPASEVGEVMAKFVPMFTDMLASGRTDFQPSEQDVAHQFLRGEHEKASHVMRMEVEGNESALYFVLDPAKFAAGSTLEDLSGEMTVFGLAERIVREGSSYSLDRYVIPGFNRTLRRAMGKDVIRNLVNGTEALRGGSQIDAEDLDVHGPAVVLNVAGVFT